MPLDVPAVIYLGAKTFDDTTRARVANAWEESGLDQAAYARMRGISPRTLRLWRSWFPTPSVSGAAGGTAAQAIASTKPERHAPEVPPGPTSVPLHEVMDALDARLAALDAAVDTVRAGVAACRASLDDLAACRSMPVGSETGVEEDGGACEVSTEEAPDSAVGQNKLPHRHAAAAAGTAHGDPRAYLLGEIRAAVQKATAMAEGTGTVPADAGRQYPMPLPNPWSRSGGLMTF